VPQLDVAARLREARRRHLRLPQAALLELDERSVRASNPDVVFSHTSTYGPDGEMADWPGVDHDGAAASGWMWGCAGEGTPLWVPWGWADYQCASNSLVGTLLAVFQRDAGGEATSVAASILGAAINATDRVLLPDGTVSPRPALDVDRHSSASTAVATAGIGSIRLATCARSAGRCASRRSPCRVEVGSSGSPSCTGARRARRRTGLYWPR
jgi:hypothetical protein